MNEWIKEIDGAVEGFRELMIFYEWIYIDDFIVKRTNGWMDDEENKKIAGWIMFGVGWID